MIRYHQDKLRDTTVPFSTQVTHRRAHRRVTKVTRTLRLQRIIRILRRQRINHYSQLRITPLRRNFTHHVLLLTRFIQLTIRSSHHSNRHISISAIRIDPPYVKQPSPPAKLSYQRSRQAGEYTIPHQSYEAQIQTTSNE